MRRGTERADESVRTRARALDRRTRPAVAGQLLQAQRAPSSTSDPCRYSYPRADGRSGHPRLFVMASDDGTKGCVDKHLLPSACGLKLDHRLVVNGIGPPLAVRTLHLLYSLHLYNIRTRTQSARMHARRLERHP